MSRSPARPEDDTQGGPARPEERLFVLDVLRGFALLGILVANMPAFDLPPDGRMAGWDPFPDPVSRATRWLVDFFVVGKFNAIFSFLFGVGFTLFLDRAQARRAPYQRLYLRRLAILFGLGVAHLLLLWFGDILSKYAILGLLLLPCRHLKDRSVILLAFAFLCIPLSHRYLSQALGEGPAHPGDYYQVRAAEQRRVYGEGTYFETVGERARVARQGWFTERTTWWDLPNYGGTMLLGLVVGRRRIFQDLPAHRRGLRLVLVCGLGLGWLFALIYASGIGWVDRSRVTPFRIFIGIAYTMNRPLVGMAYVSAVALLCLQAGWAKRLAPLASVGRMPLTNYLMQSVICTTIFYGYGLGLFGKVGPALGVIMAVAMYAVQVAYSHWWMGRFRFGPMEWLWRAATYGKAPALRIGRTATAPA